MTERPKGINPQPNFYITQDNFNQLIGSGFWRINDLPAERWNQVKDHFGNVDTIAVLASGIAPTRIRPPINTPIAGVDWVRIENSPKQGEPPLNVYHYVIGHPNESGFPVYGPAKEGSLAPHWSDLKDLEIYWENDEKQKSEGD